MHIRLATQTDIPGILNVLKASLGEISSKKTGDVWRYKHVDNPFGESLVLIAEESGIIIGVRAFMRWKWQKGENLYSAFRAVDTATHPDHQGKGIFKKLTLAALKLGEENKDHFVFNTPNKNSKPGYLKMGWEDLGKLKISISPVIPFPGKKRRINFSFEKRNNIKISTDLIDSYNNRIEKLGGIFTPKSVKYLNWRYLMNPIQEYKIYSNDKIFIAAYIKRRNFLLEFRISELLYDIEIEKDHLKSVVQSLALESNAHFFSFSDPLQQNNFSFEYSGNFGPNLFARTINLTEDFNKSLKKIDNWNYVIGDMELY